MDADFRGKRGILGGFSVCTIHEANSLDDAVSMAKDCPVLQSGADVSVFETFNVM